MKNHLIALGAGLLFSASAFAGVDVKTFPAMKAPAAETTQASMPGMMRAPLNPEAGLGTKIFAHTNVDFTGTCNYVNLFSENPSTLTRLKEVVIPGATNYDGDWGRNITLVGGWGGDGYYAYRHMQYTYETRLIDWVKVDPTTGASEELYLWNNTGALDPNWYSYPLEVLWNPNEAQKLYVLAQNPQTSTQDPVRAAIYEVDRESGEYTRKVAVMPDYYFAAAFDYNNQLYAIRWKYDAKGKFTGAILDVFEAGDYTEPISTTEVKVDGKPYYIYFQNNLAFDYSTGDLWLAGSQIVNMPSYQGSEGVSPDIKNQLIKIDPLKYTTENKGTFGYLEMIGGMYIPYTTADAQTAPARVSDLKFTPCTDGSQQVTLSWTNPSTYWNCRKMSNLSEVRIYRDGFDGAPVATLPATGQEGKAMTWTDKDAPNGVNHYFVVAYNPAGKGVPAEIDAFVGRDVPGAVQNLTAATTDGRTIQLSWDKPARGDSDGWYDDSDLSYIITRLPDNTVLATVKTTTYSDESLQDALLYSYQIVASNADGKGTPAVSNAVLAGKSIVVPYSTNFESQVDADRFQYLDKNGDNVHWEYDMNLLKLGNSMKLSFSRFETDDVLVSPGLLLEKGKVYKVVYGLDYYSPGESGQTVNYPIRLIGGNAPTAEAMTTVFDDVPEHVLPVFEVADTYTAYFTAPVDGEYYIGFEALGKDLDGAYMYVENFSIEVAPDDDLQAVGVETHLTVSTIEPNTFIVEVYNNGSAAQSDYTVAVAYIDEEGEPQIFAYTDEVPEIASHQTEYIEIEGQPDVLGEYDLVAIVDLATDGNHTNDMSPALKVSFDEAPALNTTINSYLNLANSTNAPMHFFTRYTAVQTLYTPAMTAFDRIFAGKKPVITRMAWEYNSNVNINSLKLDVYLSQTDKTTFTDNDKMQPLEGVQAAYSGTTALVKGDGYMTLDLDNEFEFDPAKTILVTVVKDESDNVGTFPTRWKAFDQDWDSSDRHSSRYQGNTAYNVAAPSGNLINLAEAPVLHLAVKTDNSGVDEIVLTGKGAVYYNAATQTVETVDYAMKSVEVYDLSGKLVKSVAVAEGATSVAVSCAKGVYLLKVNGVDGSALTLKAQF